ncbi:XRE family transcriptional regulator [Chromobacterium haemolyticum]|uniref:XRE family transcriptional regulator n=1 Tax=Chromobacterium fluminis TaxID=3044269 RepID=A0ABX0L5Z2_9NEIS|nr:XRE family transcriptional regulator [Chromobacterium haemolyticum]NHR04488.1 XRE family transcriptional regulator [Chromobacterium haemolyticum]
MAKNEFSKNAYGLPVPSHNIRAVVLDKIKSLLASNDWTQIEAARLCGLTQPRISDLWRGNTGRFSLDALVDIAATLAKHSTQLEDMNMQQHTADEGQRLVAEFMARIAAKPIQAAYPVATGASFTERGGKVMATSPIYLLDVRVALVGDTVRYPDGTVARIISGSGEAGVVDGRPMAIVGSELDNGDRVIGPIHNDFTITQYADEPPIAGLLDPAYVPEPNESAQHG